MIYTTSNQTEMFTGIDPKSDLLKHEESNKIMLGCEKGIDYIVCL